MKKCDPISLSDTFLSLPVVGAVSVDGGYGGCLLQTGVIVRVAGVAHEVLGVGGVVSPVAGEAQGDEEGEESEGHTQCDHCTLQPAHLDSGGYHLSRTRLEPGV